MMDSFELNKIAGSVLGTLVFVMGLSFISDLIFHTEPPETPGYAIEVAEQAGPAEEAPAAEEEVPIAQLLAQADAGQGEAVARKCAACHTFEQGGANKVGPNLWNVVGRKPGGHEGFKYSSAMQEFGAEHAWTFEELNAFINNPKGTVSGTSMGFAGVKKAEDRADLLAYLRTLSDSPQPLPSE